MLIEATVERPRVAQAALDMYKLSRGKRVSENGLTPD
jgi:hypothetical protein